VCRPQSAQTLVLATNGKVAEEFRNTSHMLKVLLVGNSRTGKSKLTDAMAGAPYSHTVSVQRVQPCQC